MELNPKPSTISDAILNLRRIFESNLIFDQVLFTKLFLSKYLGGEKVEITPKVDQLGALVTDFGNLANNNNCDAAALHNAFIGLDRKKTANGTISLTARLDLYARGNSITLPELQWILGSELSISDPLSAVLGMVFHNAVTNSQGNHFYRCKLNGASGTRIAYAQIGSDGTLSQLSLEIKEATPWAL